MAAKKYIGISEDRKHQLERDLMGDVMGSTEMVRVLSNINNLANQDTTTAFSRNTIDCQFRPQFVEIFEDGGQAYCRLSNQYIHGVVLVSVPRGGIATITLPSVKIKGFAGLVSGADYALDTVLREVVVFDPESETQLYIGFAVSETEIEFSPIVPKITKKENRPLSLMCQAGAEAPEGDIPLSLMCKGSVVPPPAGGGLIIGELEGPQSSYSYYDTNLTVSGRRPVITFYARLNGAIVPLGSDLQYSVNGGVTWHYCGRWANYKHVAEGNVSSLPLAIGFSSSYTLVVRLAINPSVVSNLLTVTTGPEPGPVEEIDVDKKRYIVWNGADFDRIRKNGLWQVAYDHGVRVMAPFGIFNWSKFEQGEGNYNFEDLEYHIEACATTGYQLLLWGLPRHSRNVGIWGEQIYRRKSGGGWEQYYRPNKDSSFLPESSWERDRYGNIAGAKGWAFGLASFSFSDDYAVEKYCQLTARIAHLIWTGSVAEGPRSGTPYRNVVHAYGQIGGGFSETSFNLQYRVPDPVPGDPDQERQVAYEIIYSEASMRGFRVWLEFERYGSINALNNSWGSTFSNFSQINKDNISKPSEYSWGVGYDDNNTTKDLFAFQVFQHATFYAAVNEAIRFPSSVVPGLVDSTDLLTACYVTENHSYAEGVRYGVVPMRTMYEDFDIHFSSTTAGDSPTYYSRKRKDEFPGGVMPSYYPAEYKDGFPGNVLWDFALRAAEFAGTFGGTRFGQERDGDAVEATIGYSQIYNTVKRYGFRYQAIALQNEPKEWFSTEGIPLMQDTDGIWRTRKDSLKYLYDTQIKDTEHPAAPAFVSTLSFTERQALVSPYNPNGIKEAFTAASSLNVKGEPTNLVKVQVVKDLHLITLEIEAGSIIYIPYVGQTHGVGFRAKINGQQVRSTQSFFTGMGYEFSLNGSNWYQLLGKNDGNLATGFPSSGAWVSGGTYSLRFRAQGAPFVSNLVTVTIP